MALASAVKTELPSCSLEANVFEGVTAAAATVKPSLEPSVYTAL